MFKGASDCYIDNAGNMISNTPKIYGQDRYAENKIFRRFDMGDLSYQELNVFGMQIIYGDWRFKNLAATDVRKQGEFVEMHFTLLGAGEVCDSLSGNIYQFQENKQNLFFMSSLSGRSQFRTQRFRFFELRLSPEYFLEITKGNSAHIALSKQANFENSAEPVSAGRPISSSMHQCINNIINCPVGKSVKPIYLKAKCMELIALQLHSLQEAPARRLVCKSAYDQSRINMARLYMIENIAEPPSLKELSRICGINEFKLKKGFQEIYQNTVFGYLSEYRLSEAKRLLESRTHTIKEISFQLGYSSVQHFTKAFKLKYMVSPGKI